MNFLRHINSTYNLYIDFDTDQTHVSNLQGEIILTFTADNVILDKYGVSIGNIHWGAVLCAKSDNPPISVELFQKHAESHIDLEALYAKNYLETCPSKTP